MNIITSLENQDVILQQKEIQNNSSVNVFFLSNSQINQVLQAIFSTNSTENEQIEEKETEIVNESEIETKNEVEIKENINQKEISEDIIVTETKNKKTKIEKNVLYQDFQKENFQINKQSLEILSQKYQVCTGTIRRHYNEFIQEQQIINQEKNEKKLLELYPCIQKYYLTEFDLEPYDREISEGTFEKTWHLKNMEEYINDQIRTVMEQNNLVMFHPQKYCVIEKIIQECLKNNITNFEVFQKMILVNEISLGYTIVTMIWENIYLPLYQRNQEIIQEQNKILGAV